MTRTFKWLLPITVGALLAIVSVNTANAGCSDKCTRLCALNLKLCKLQAKEAKQIGIIGCANGATGNACTGCLTTVTTDFVSALADCKHQQGDCLRVCAS